MNRHVNAIAGRLSLRAPQRRSLEILDRITTIAPPRKDANFDEVKACINAEFPSVTDFERDFPSLCFALATGVGKTRLMGAFISYLHLAHRINNFFVMAPNLTIYNKLIADFTPNTKKYVFTGIAEFANDPPAIITGDNYEAMASTLFDVFLRCKINIFNISKINTEVRGGKSPRIKRLSEYIGESYFQYLANLPDLVLLMDESHRYRASAGIRAINELKPVLGLELTATPLIETARGTVPFKNVIYDYPLSRAMEDGFVKEPAVVTRKNFSTDGMSTDEIERLKLEDGIRLHESIKVELQTYARETGNNVVKPFVLVIARDTTHASQLLQLVESDAFFSGRYRNRAIQVDSSKTGSDEEEMITRLLHVEQSDDPTEIVIHVNMLKEGWDVTNLYTIVPLRAANARVLVEQSIGRGLRLPYGRRTGVSAIDRLNIVAHDRFQEIIDEANRPGNAIRLKEVYVDPTDLVAPPRTVVAQTRIERSLGVPATDDVQATTDDVAAFTSPQEQHVAQVTYAVIKRLENEPSRVPTLAHLTHPEVQAAIITAVKQELQPTQLALEGIQDEAAIERVIATTTSLVAQQTIDIPRILVLPRGDVRSGYHEFTLQLDTLRYPPVSEELWIQHLRTRTMETITLGHGGIQERRLEDYIVSVLVDFDDVAYDQQADLLYALAGQTIAHLRTYLTEEETRKVLRCYQREIANFIHAQMQEHYWEEATEYEVHVTKGFTELKRAAYTMTTTDILLDYRTAPQDKTNMAKYLFTGYQHCLLVTPQKFQSDTERRLTVILEREGHKWFKPAKGQFQIFYRLGQDHLEYQPDFVVETSGCIYMLETKAANQMSAPDVLLKMQAAVTWCGHASDHAQRNGGKRWHYVLLPHDAITENMTIDGLATRYRTGHTT